MSANNSLYMKALISIIFLTIVTLFTVDFHMTSQGEESLLQFFARIVSVSCRRFKIKISRLINKNYDKEIRERKISCLAFLLAELLSADFDYEKEGRIVISNYLDRYYDPDFVLQVNKQLEACLSSGEFEADSKHAFYKDINKLYSKIERYFLLDMVHEIGAIGGINEQEKNLLLTFTYDFGLDGKDRDFYYYKYYKYYNDKRRRTTTSETKREDSRKKQSSSKHQDKYQQPNSIYTQNGAYYAVLGLPDGASIDEVKAAYRSLSKKWHPDTILDENLKRLYAQRFIELNEAYKKLVK